MGNNCWIEDSCNQLQLEFSCRIDLQIQEGPADFPLEMVAFLDFIDHDDHDMRDFGGAWGAISYLMDLDGVGFLLTPCLETLSMARPKTSVVTRFCLKHHHQNHHHDHSPQEAHRTSSMIHENY